MNLSINMDLGEYLKDLGEKLFEQAEIAKYNDKDRHAYQESKKHYLDMKNALDTSFRKGKEEREMEIALQMLQKKYPIDEIIALTGLSKEEIESLK